MQHHFRCERIVAALLVCGLSGHAAANDGLEVKHPRPLPVTSDVKVPALPVVKTEARSIRPPQTAAVSAPADKPAAMQSQRAPRRDLDSVYFDAPGDGSLWARGRTYKASFDADGATYIPFLGACAPQNHPVRFALSSVRVGDRALAFTAAISAERSDNRVTYDHGSVVERYDLAPDSLEQSFVFDALPSREDLAVRIDVSSDLPSRETADGLEFFCALGAARYGRAFVTDGSGRRAQAETVLSNGAIEIRVPAEFLKEAALPVTIDPLVTAFTVEDGVPDDVHADIAYDSAHDRYGVCWENAFSSTDHDVWVQLQDADGATIGSSTIGIDLTSNYWARPKIANNLIASQFLVVAQVGDPSGGARIVRGRTRDVGVAAVGPQFTISTGLSGDQFNPDVGGDPNPTPPTFYCVVWERAFSAGDHDLFAQLVLDDSSLLSPTPITIENTFATLDTNPSVSKSDGAPTALSQEWNIVWQREFSSSDHDIYGAQLHWDGTLTHATYVIDVSTHDSRQPTVSSLLDGGTAPRQYMVTWYSDAASDHDIYGVIAKGASMLTPTTDLTVLEGPPFSTDHLDPRVDSDGVQFGVAFRQTFAPDPNYAASMSTFAFQGGAIVNIEGHEILDNVVQEDSQIQVASRHSGGGTAPRYAVLWTAEHTATDHDILGALYDTPLVRSYCSAGFDGVAHCPCFNSGTFGHGCQNSAGTGGALLSATGTPSLATDSLFFHQTGELPSALSIVLQGNANIAAGAAFGDGVRCAGGSLKRLYAHNASSGLVNAPVGSDMLVHARSAALGDTISSGDTRYYQVYYRDPNLTFCPSPPGNSWNVGNALSVTWIP